MKERSTPMMEASARGAVEKATMPSMEYRNSLKKDHLVSPATRSTFSYSNHLVRKPTHSYSPLEKRLYSFRESRASSTGRVISL